MIILTISTTGIAYLFFFLALAFLAYRFFQYWRKNQDTTSKLFYFFSISIAVLAFIRMITGIFFAKNTQVLAISVILVSFSEVIMAAIVAYLIIYLKFPKISPWVGFIIIFILGSFVTYLTYTTLPERNLILEPSGALNLSFKFGSNFWYPILRLLVLSLSMIPMIVVFLQQYKSSNVFYIKTRTLGLSIALFLGLIIGLIDFIFISIFRLSALDRDITMSIISIILFFVIYFTQKPNPSKTQ